MADFVFYIGWAVCAAGALAIMAGAWWLALRVLWEALKDASIMAIFVRWSMLKYIRSVRRDKRAAVARHVAHTQKAMPDER